MSFQKTISCVVSLIALAATMQAMRPVDAAETVARTNVIIIFADDLGYGDLACFGHPTFKTPNIDRMAKQGIRMTQFYVPMPYCAPSRAALLTGRYPWRCGITGNPAPDGRVPRNNIGIADSERTLGEAFQKAGYATCCIGKWHLGHVKKFMPTRHGFDEYLGILYSNDMRPVQLFDGEKVVEYPVVQALLTKKYTARAIKFIRRNKQKPFFLYLPHAMPHKPLAASEDFYKKTGTGLYGDVIAELDWSVGQILKTLKDLNLDESTLVIFTSDNGPWYGGSTGGLRGMKGRSWDGGIRVPMIARWPGKIPPNRVLDDVASSVDLFPTVLTAAGVSVPTDKKLDGRNILPLLQGKSKLPPKAIFAMRGRNLAVIREGHWKLHVYNPGVSRIMANAEKWIDPRGPDGVTILAPYEQYKPNVYPGVLTGDHDRGMMLFDITADPSEQKNVADQNPKVVKRLKEKFDIMRSEMQRRKGRDGSDDWENRNQHRVSFPSCAIMCVY